MSAHEARIEFQAGRLTAEQLLEMLERQERLMQRLYAEIDRLKQRLAQYEPDARAEPTPRAPQETSLSMAYSLDAEQRRRRSRRRRRGKSPGRQPTQLKFADAQRFQNIYA